MTSKIVVTRPLEDDFSTKKYICGYGLIECNLIPDIILYSIHLEHREQVL